MTHSLELLAVGERRLIMTAYFWAGEGRGEKVIHWIPPTPINVGSGDQLPVVDKMMEINEDEIGWEIDSTFFESDNNSIH